jgi:transposase
MLYVGLDIHSKRITVCVLDENGKPFQRCEVRTVIELRQLLEALPDRFEVCYEASCGYGYYHDELYSLASRVVVAHPGQLRLIFRSKHKNDRRDAEKLAKLLFLGEVPTVHVPSQNVRAWRELITCRRHRIERRTQAKNGIRALLRGVGVVAPARPGLWTKKGQVWLRALELRPAQALRRDLLLEEIETLTRQMRRLETELNRYSQEDLAVFQLRSIPGVGIRTAEPSWRFWTIRTASRTARPSAATLDWSLPRTSPAG